MMDIYLLDKHVCGHQCVCLYDNIKAKMQQYKEYLTCCCFFLFLLFQGVMHCFLWSQISEES